MGQASATKIYPRGNLGELDGLFVGARCVSFTGNHAVEPKQKQDGDFSLGSGDHALCQNVY